MRTTAVVVHYGDPGPTLSLLTQLEQCKVDRIVVANDGKPRPAGLDLAVRWIVPERNLGFGEAFNQAIAEKQADFYLLLNPDVELPVSTLVKCLEVMHEDPNIGIVGPVLRFPDGSLQSGAAALTRLRRAARTLIEPGGGPMACTWVTGAAMLMRSEVAREVGMDGSYFIGCEDVDICVRAAKAGWSIVCHGGAAATHHQSQAIGGAGWAYYRTRNRVWFARQHFGVTSAVLNWLWEAARFPRIALGDLIKRGSATALRLGSRGLIDAWVPKPSRSAGPLRNEPRGLSASTRGASGW